MMMKKICLALLVLAPLLFLLPIDSVEAHGYIVRSTPADRSVLTRAPNQVQIWFSEGIEPEFSRIEVFNQAGEQVDLGDGGVDPRNSAKLVVSLPANLPDGAYLVKMRPVFVSDGHAVGDTLVFWIGEQVGSVDSGGSSDQAVFGEVIWRLFLTLGLTVYLGTMVAYLLILRPAWQNPAHPLGKLPPRIMQRLRLLLWASLIIANIANLAALLQMSANLFETDLATVFRDELWNIVLAGTNFGDVWGIRMGLLAAMLVIQVVAAQQAQNRPGSTHVLWILNTVIAVLSLGTLSFISHAVGSEFWAIPALLVTYIHLISVSVWVGSLVAIALILRPALLALSPTERSTAFLTMVRRFSAIAVVAVSLIITTGIFNSLINLSQPQDLSQTTYGITLIAKILLIMPLLGLALMHHLAIHPTAFGWLRQMLPSNGRFSALPSTFRIEAVFALVVLFAAAWLPATPPPEPTTARSDLTVDSQSTLTDGYGISLSVNPGAVGANAYDVNISQNGQPIDVETMQIQFALPAMGLYTIPVVLETNELGLWVGADGEIDRAGEWLALIDFRPNNSELTQRAVIAWDFVREVDEPNARTATVWHGLAGLAVIFVIARWAVPRSVAVTTQLQWTPETVTIGALAITFTLVSVMGGALIFQDASQRVSEQLNQPPEVVNPMISDILSPMRGQALYVTNECQSCHGADGSGQTERAATLDRPIPNLRETLYNRDDEDLLRILSRGIVNRHQFGTSLNASEHWDIINYLRQMQFVTVN